MGTVRIHGVLVHLPARRVEDADLVVGEERLPFDGDEGLDERIFFNLRKRNENIRIWG